MVLAFVVLQVIRSIGLVSQTYLVDEAYSAFSISGKYIPGRRTVNIVLPADKIPHEISPVHPVQLIIKEERKILSHRRLLVFSTEDRLSSLADIRIVECLVFSIR